MLSCLLISAFIPNADTLLRKVASTYQTLSSYQDTVQVLTTQRGKTSRQAFETKFRRPAYWKIVYLEHQAGGTVNKSVLWSNGKTTQLWADLVGKNTDASDMGLGLGSMAMIAGDFVQIVPNLLDPKSIYSSTLAELTKPVLLSEAKVGPSLCHRIVGKEEAGSELTVWVDTKRFLVLRIVRQTTHPRFGRLVTAATFTPVANPKIATASFNFIPPK